MKIGDLVKWKHPSETAVGIVGVVMPSSSFIYWSDGDSQWHDNEDLEVVCK
jgi:hypothetical protein